MYVCVCTASMVRFMNASARSTRTGQLSARESVTRASARRGEWPRRERRCVIRTIEFIYFDGGLFVVRRRTVEEYSVRRMGEAPLCHRFLCYILYAGRKVA